MSLDNFSNLETNLKEKWVSITFLKKDGSQRDILCTTNLDLVPVEKHPKKKETTEAPPEKKVDEDRLYVVFEKDNSWRSFRRSQIVSWAEV